MSKNSLFLRTGLVGVCALLITSFSYAEDGNDAHAEKKPAGPERTAEELSQACTACHGETGVSISPEFPNIAGQYRSYLIYVLKQYRSGERANAVMQSFVTNLTDDEITKLADFYSAQTGLSILPD